jgi:hypothetical protein
VEKIAHDDFSILNSFFQLNKLAGENKKREIFGDFRKSIKFCMEIDLNIFHNFCIGNFDQMSTILK